MSLIIRYTCMSQTRYPLLENRSSRQKNSLLLSNDILIIKRNEKSYNIFKMNRDASYIYGGGG